MTKDFCLRVSSPNNMIHIAADTISNAGDYILVRSLKQLVEHEVNQSIHWSNVDVRATITDSFIEACNHSQGVILGGGGFFLKDTNQMIFQAGSGLAP